MSVRMLQACKRVARTSTQQFVLNTLADCHNEHTSRCDPSIDHLMSETKYSNRAIITAIMELEKDGHLTVERKFGTCNRYTLHPKSSEPSSPVPPTSEPASPVNVVHVTCEPSSLPPVNVVPKAVNVVHTNRKEPEVTGKEPEPSGVRVSKTDWRAAAKAEADAASATPLPLLWSQPLAVAVREFFAHRHDLACKPATKSAHYAWTPRAASNTIASIDTAVTMHGEGVVLARIQSATAAGWKGLNLDSMRSNGPPQRPQQRDNLGQRAGEIRTDLGANKLKDL